MYDVFTNLSIDVTKTTWYKIAYPSIVFDFFTLKIFCIIMPIICIVLFGFISLLYTIPFYLLINQKLYNFIQNFLICRYIRRALVSQKNSSIFEIVNVKNFDSFLLEDVTTLFCKTEFFGKMYYFRDLRLLLFIPQIKNSRILVIDPSNYRTIRITIYNSKIIQWIDNEIRFMLEMRISKKNTYLSLISESKYEYKSLSEGKRDTI